jgi:aldehyde dehydrogenase (NAD+)
MASNNASFDEFAQMQKELKGLFNAGVNLSYESRMKNLDAVKLAINTYYDEACGALDKDLGRSYTEASGELQAVMAEIALQQANLKKWMEPEQKYTHMLLAPSHTEVRREPFGVVLVIGPFNYPMNLCLVPLVGAIAAGNLVVLKPSEQTTGCEQWFLNRLGSVVPRDVLRVVTGDIPRTTALLAQPWDFIFFTGSPAVGKIVSHAAAEHLTPTVMELGGKAPVYIDKSCGSINEAAKRIAFGKFINSGQTCMAPDYVLVHESIHKEMVDTLVSKTEEFYSAQPHKSPDFGRMCTEPHTQRSMKLIETSGGTVKCGGHLEADVSNRYVPPTIIDRPSLDSPLMKSEIFGPILPVIPVKDDNDAIKMIRSLDPQPLALYIFSTDSAVNENLLNSVQSGDAMINETFMHAINPDVPFGGVGKSGHGTYRGRLSFEAFTYARGVLFRHHLFDIDQTLPFNVRFPPSGKMRKLMLPHMIGLFPCVPRVFHFRPKLFALTAVFALAIGLICGAEQNATPPITYALGVFRSLFKQ